MKRELVFQEGIVKVYHGESRKLDSGKIFTPSIIELCPNAVSILAVDSEENVFLVKQFRYGADMEMYELPAGLVDKGEDFSEAAKRELLEETGCIAENWKKIYSFYPSPGVLTEQIHIFSAENLTETGVQKLDESEELTFIKVPFQAALEMIEKGEICDAKTIIALLYYDLHSKNK